MRTFMNDFLKMILKCR